MELKYSVKPTDRHVKAMGRDMNVSFKSLVVIADAIRGLKLTKAIEYMNDVIALKKPVPYRRFNTGVGHRRADNAKVGKYPKKAAKHVLAVLMNLQASAEFRGYDTDRIRLTHVQALKGISRTRRKPKGRWTVWNTEYCHIQVMGEEK